MAPVYSCCEINYVKIQRRTYVCILLYHIYFFLQRSKVFPVSGEPVQQGIPYNVCIRKETEAAEQSA